MLVQPTESLCHLHKVLMPCESILNSSKRTTLQRGKGSLKGLRVLGLLGDSSLALALEMLFKLHMARSPRPRSHSEQPLPRYATAGGFRTSLHVPRPWPGKLTCRHSLSAGPLLAASINSSPANKGDEEVGYHRVTNI